MRPYGQHFLHDKNILDKIARLADLQAGQTILEIGPGRGALTRVLLDSGCRVIAVEIDEKLIADLEKKFVGKPFELIAGDVLKNKHQLNETVLERLDGIGPYKLVSNLPYGPGTSIFVNLLQTNHPPVSGVVMLQEEVVDRIVAQHGNKNFGALTVIIANVAQANKMAIVPPGCFSPPPQVTSSLLSFTSHSPIVSIDALGRLLAKAFQQRRKKMRRLIQHGYDLENCHVDSSLRPEQISVNQWFDLAQTVKEC